ncbi:helix-turn-helix domain-containing protein [Candidatus Woesearchaeota archaeon]|nr:helix-turn-helix domain-containing protein [Candidatus Woesearchaeota archaeon]
MNEKQFKELMQGINVLIHIQTASLIRNKTLRENIILLDQAGLGPSKIAQILGKKPGHISKELTLIKKKR